MPPVFAHGRLRLYLLKLLDEAPRHGYEVIRLLEERFQGLYAPSAGTVYPRLAKLEREGLVTHATEGGRKVYSITEAGRAELAGRQGELAELELEIRESVSELAAEIREDVRGVAGDLRREMRAAAEQARASGGRASGRSGRSSGNGRGGGGGGETPPWGDKEAWRQAKEELRRAKEQWQEQARRATEDSRRAQRDAQRARKQAKDAQEQARDEVQRIARRVQEQTQEHIRAGDWQSAVRDGFAEITRELNRFSRQGGQTAGEAAPGTSATAGEGGGGGTESAGTGAAAQAEATAAPPEPEWARETVGASGDPARELERLLDRFRDDIRDAARDHGVTEAQLKDARRHLSTAAAHIGVVLRTPRD
ncbi:MULTISPECIES: PadR family transcriptional regulator [Streptomyces]|uniref:PadR family transcriptional regulator n=1 Tax=Streptomyces lycii TaxID=2654337 RepID=A0ABQ7FCN6_9ACTN|nr:MULTISPECIES: PadR family transcriptional regulator [Streptomyces]KAF4405469.1 PadR family transcriptional regulator [Streptomyces lycii]PGH52319.1 PadR family transcriptional regulator [Streptomyces sp. Ru87]